jgi:large subunit ribosomal protein L6
MSRIGKNPIVVPKGVEVTLSAEQVAVKGPLGTLTQRLSSDIRLGARWRQAAVPGKQRLDAGQCHVRHHPGPGRQHGRGCDQGIRKEATLVGVGYRAQAQGDKLNLALGFSHPVVHQMPKGVKVETPSQTEIVLRGTDKQQVGQVAAEVRAYRSPEPYKGKGVRYAGERVVIKETKKK